MWHVAQSTHNFLILEVQSSIALSSLFCLGNSNVDASVRRNDTEVTGKCFRHPLNIKLTIDEH